MLGIEDAMGGFAGAPYHIGLSVSDLMQARETLGMTFGAQWTAEQCVQFPDYDFRYVFSLTGPPYLELCQGAPGSPFYRPEGGITLHHLGYWTDDFEADAQRMLGAGLQQEWEMMSGGRRLAAHFRAADGLVCELIDISRRAPFLELIRSARVELTKAQTPPDSP